MAKRNRRGRKGSRTPLPTILICCQGEVTEVEHFEEYKRSKRAPNITIKPNPLDPVKLVDHTTSLIRHHGYEEVYIVIDVDDSPEEQLRRAIKLAKQNTTKKSPVNLVISHPSFELWLLAHTQAVQQQSVRQADLVRALRKAKILQGEPPKHISFKVLDITQVPKNIPTIPLNTLGENPSTAIPHLIWRIDEISRQHHSGR